MLVEYIFEKEFGMGSEIVYYKGYTARPEYSEEDGIFCGTLLSIRDMICFHSEKADDFERSFHQAVDDYLALCAESGREPDKPQMGAES